jgi:hypothetical protein
VLKEAEVAEFGDARVHVGYDPGRDLHRGDNAWVSGTQTVIAIAFEGDPALFQVQPGVFGLSAPRGEVVGDELRLTYTQSDQDEVALQREHSDTLQSINSYLMELRRSAEEFNRELESYVRQLIGQRKKKVLADARMVASLNLPIRERPDAPKTYVVPTNRRQVLISRPKAPSSKFQPEPALAMEVYEHILSVMQNMVTVMEQSPRAFDGMKEEHLRSHFLVQLNGHYEGGATGETFNYQGKTDILIKAEGRNVFIAECKFWKGEKQLLVAIDQLLSYLSWRDTKTAILVFNRQKNFTEVLASVRSAVPKHKHFKRDLGQRDESSFRYVFHQPDDPNRELLLTIMAFDIPRKPGTVD